MARRSARKRLGNTSLARFANIKVGAAQRKGAGFGLWLNSRIFRFLVVGLVNTAFSYCVYALLLFTDLEYRLANLGALLIGIAFSFKTQGKYVFANVSNRLFFRFVVIWGLLYVVNILIIGGLIRIGLNAYISGAIALIPVIILSYLLQKTFVFRSRSASLLSSAL